MRGLLGLALALVGLAAQPALAHGLRATATIEGEEILLEVRFSNGHPAERAEVTVSVDGADVATGTTDAQGMFRYRPVSYGVHVFSAVEIGLHHARAEVFFGPFAGVTPATSATHAETPPPPPTQDEDRPGDPIGAVPWPRIALGVLVIVGLTLLLRATQSKPDTPWLGDRDDRARVLTLVVVLVGAGAVETLSGALIALALGLVAAFSLGMRPGRLARRLWPLLALLTPLFLLTPLWHRPLGSALLLSGWSWGPTDVGLLEAARVASRVLAIGLLAVAALDAAPFDRTIKALQDLRVPSPLTHTALLTYRYLFLFQGDLQRVRHALRSRGFRARPSLGTANTFGAVTGGLLVRSLARTERVEQAMRCRGYTGELVLRSSKGAVGADHALVVAAVLVAGALVVVDRAGLERLW